MSKPRKSLLSSSLRSMSFMKRPEEMKRKKRKRRELLAGQSASSSSSNVIKSQRSDQSAKKQSKRKSEKKKRGMEHNTVGEEDDSEDGPMVEYDNDRDDMFAMGTGRMSFGGFNPTVHQWQIELDELSDDDTTGKYGYVSGQSGKRTADSSAVTEKPSSKRVSDGLNEKDSISPPKRRRLNKNSKHDRRTKSSDGSADVSKVKSKSRVFHKPAELR